MLQYADLKINKMKNQDPDQIIKERYENLRRRVDEFKPTWDKNGVIQYETEHIDVLQRLAGKSNS